MEINQEIITSSNTVNNKKNKFNVDKIISNLKTREGKGLVRDICDILGEPRRDILETVLSYISKDMLIGFVEKTMNFQNEGGVLQKVPAKIIDNLEPELPTDKEKDTLIIIKHEFNKNGKFKSSGGVLFDFIRRESGLPKEDLKKIFTKDYKGRNERRKLLKKIESLII